MKVDMEKIQKQVEEDREENDKRELKFRLKVLKASFESLSPNYKDLLDVDFDVDDLDKLGDQLITVTDILQSMSGQGWQAKSDEDKRVINSIRQGLQNILEMHNIIEFADKQQDRLMHLKNSILMKDSYWRNFVDNALAQEK